jgi:hypothetical protein
MLALGGSGDTDWRRWRRVLSMRRRWMWLTFSEPKNSALIISFTSATSRTLRLGSFAVNTDKIQRNPEQI